MFYLKCRVVHTHTQKERDRERDVAFTGSHPRWLQWPGLEPLSEARKQEFYPGLQVGTSGPDTLGFFAALLGAVTGCRIKREAVGT